MCVCVHRIIRVSLTHFIRKDTKNIHFTSPVNIIETENTTNRGEESADAIFPNAINQSERVYNFTFCPEATSLRKENIEKTNTLDTLR